MTLIAPSDRGGATAPILFSLVAEQYHPLDPLSPILIPVDAGPPLPFAPIPEPLTAFSALGALLSTDLYPAR